MLYFFAQMILCTLTHSPVQISVAQRFLSCIMRITETNAHLFHLLGNCNRNQQTIRTGITEVALDYTSTRKICLSSSTCHRLTQTWRLGGAGVAVRVLVLHFADVIAQLFTVKCECGVYLLSNAFFRYENCLQMKRATFPGTTTKRLFPQCIKFIERPAKRFWAQNNDFFGLK